MATTFSSNIGSNSKGGFSAYAVTTDDYVTAFYANMTTGEVINATDGEAQYATTLSENQLEALSTNLKGLLAAAVASGADPTAAPLAYLRKLAGFVPLDNDSYPTYNVTTQTVDGVDYEEFYIDYAGTVMMYVPNSAAAGLFTGAGSDNGSSSSYPPSGPAGGVLNGTYPDPATLAIRLSGSGYTLPVQALAGTGTETSYFKLNNVSGSEAAGPFEFSGADGLLNGDGQDASIRGGASAEAGTTGGVGACYGGNGGIGTGGDAILDAGTGGTASGIARVGTTNASATYLGRRLVETRHSGLTRFFPTTIALSANGQNVPAERTCVQLLTSAAYTGLGVDAPTYDGQMMIIINTSESIQTFETGAGTYLRLGAATRALNNNGTLLLVAVNSRWNEVAFTAG